MASPPVLNPDTKAAKAAKSSKRSAAPRASAPAAAPSAPAKTGKDGGSVVLRRYKLTSSDVELGMFVAELDRPWIDTPFLLQGFVVDDAGELATLKRVCRHVFVDLDLSNPEVVESIRRAAIGSMPVDEEPARDMRRLVSDDPGPDDGTAPARGRRDDDGPIARRSAAPKKPTRAGPIRADTKVSSGTRERFREMVRTTSGLQVDEIEPVGMRGMLSRFLGLFRSKKAAEQRERRQLKESKDAAQAEILQALPAGTKLARYRDRRDVVEELPRARKSLDRSERILAKLVTDVRTGTVPQVAEVQAAVGDMVDSMVDNPDALMWVARLRDESQAAYMHGVKMSLYMIALGRHLGFPKEQLSVLGTIGMLADVGKIKLPRALLEKPGMLNQSEHAIVKEHVRIGLDAISAQGSMPAEVIEGIGQHHERMDGSGYPKGLSGPEIGIWGRISGIADTFSALTTARPYANAMAPQDALLNLYQWAGTSFHEPLVEQFVQSVGVFPVGSLIELSSGEIAVVVAQNRVRRLEPRVLVLTSADKRPLAQPMERDLFQVKSDVDGKRLRIARGLPAGAYGLKLRDFYADSLVQANKLL